MSKKQAQYRLALLTGGSSGIGLAVATQLVSCGTSVILIARRIELLAEAKASLEKIATGQATVKILSVDVSDHEAVERLLPPCLDESGTPDLLYAGAGIAHPDHFENITHEIYQRTIDVNLGGAWNILSTVVPRMKTAGGGKIVIVSSGGGFVGFYGYTAYSASKFALMGLSQCLRMELKPDNIDVKILCPSDTDTPQLAAEEKTKPAETRQITGNAKVMTAQYVAGILLKKLKGRSFVIIPGFMLNLTWWLYRLLPGLIHAFFDNDVRTARKAQK